MATYNVHIMDGSTTAKASARAFPRCYILTFYLHTMNATTALPAIKPTTPASWAVKTYKSEIIRTVCSARCRQLTLQHVAALRLVLRHFPLKCAQELSGSGLTAHRPLRMTLHLQCPRWTLFWRCETTLQFVLSLLGLALTSLLHCMCCMLSEGLQTTSRGSSLTGLDRLVSSCLI